MRAGQGGDVDDRVRVVLGGAGQRVGQDETALGVGVEHLDGLAAVHAQHVAGAGGGAGRHVLGEREPAGDVDLRPSLAAATTAAKTAAAPLMSHFIVSLWPAGFSEMPPES